MNSALTKNGQRLRDTGLKAVGQVPWGSHFCVFYETKKDLLEIVVPFFKTGLQANEFCLWIVANSELLTINEATAVLHEAVPDLDRLLKNGNIEIVPYSKWFLTGRAVDIQKAITRFRQKVSEAARRDSKARGSLAVRLGCETICARGAFAPSNKDSMTNSRVSR